LSYWPNPNPYRAQRSYLTSLCGVRFRSNGQNFFISRRVGVSFLLRVVV